MDMVVYGLFVPCGPSGLYHEVAAVFVILPPWLRGGPHSRAVSMI